jgi:hypothetical protein
MSCRNGLGFKDYMHMYIGIKRMQIGPKTMLIAQKQAFACTVARQKFLY